MKETWAEAVEAAVRRYVRRTGSPVFAQRALIHAELDVIVADVASVGLSAQQMLRRELQHLCDVGVLEALDGGAYRLRDAPPSAITLAFTKGVFVVGSDSIDNDEPERFYRFGARWSSEASKLVGKSILYQEATRAGGRGYFAVANVDRIVADPHTEGLLLALIEKNSFFELGLDVPLQHDGRAVDRGLFYPNGRLNKGRASRSVRSITDEDFDRILGLGLVGPTPLPPSQESPAMQMLREEPEPWTGPVDRLSERVTRAVRNRQFRHRGLSVYNFRCAVTGFGFLTPDGRAEVQAAHAMSLEAGGPDSVTNCLALTGTIHWMFDRGSLSFTDDGHILLSRRIHDRRSLERLIPADRKARFPADRMLRPNPRYLDWHRTHCFKP